MLYLLPPGFKDNGQHQYCPECAEIWGLLAYYPALKETVTIVYETIEHPRAGLVSQLGEGQWNCPTLILDSASPDGPGVKERAQIRYIHNARQIGQYWASLYGTAVPR
ncbi:MAG: DUF3088 family protein [Pseudomonadota bacterium]